LYKPIFREGDKEGLKSKRKKVRQGKIQNHEGRVKNNVGSLYKALRKTKGGPKKKKPKGN